MRKSFNTILLSLFLLVFFVVPAFGVDYYPNRDHSGTVGKSNRVWLTGYFDYMNAGVLTGGVATTHAYAAAAVWTLSATERKSMFLTVSSGNANTGIIAPATTGRIYVVRNTTAYTITIYNSDSGGTGVSIASGKTAVVWFNGTYYMRLTADATN
jgi:hypothetical protein